MENNNYYMYVLLCADQTFYCGFTNNVQKRIDTHNAGKGAKYTKIRRPVKLLYSEEFPSKSEALRAEYAFKQLSRKKKEEYLKVRGIDSKKWNRC